MRLTEHGKDMRFNSKNNAIKQIKENGNKRSEQRKIKTKCKKKEQHRGASEFCKQKILNSWKYA